MSKKLSFLSKSFQLRGFKIFWFFAFVLVPPLPARARDITFSEKSTAQDLNEKADSRKENNVNDSHSKKTSGENRQIVLIQPFATNSISCSSPNPKSYLKAGSSSTEIIIDHDELKLNQIKVRFLYQYVDKNGLRTDLLAQIREGIALLKSAESYYTDGIVELSDEVKGTNFLALRIGRLCEYEGGQILKPAFDEFYISVQIPGPGSLISDLLNEKIKEYPFIYSSQEKHDFWLEKPLYKSSVDLSVNKIQREFDSFPVSKKSFFSQLTFNDFYTLWCNSQSNRNLKRADFILWQSKNTHSKAKRKKNIFRNLATVHKVSIPTKRQVRDACVDGISKFFSFKRWVHQNVQRPLTNFIRSKTGDLILASPHLKPFNRKYGFVNFDSHFSPSEVKYDRSESLYYRWQHYNKIEYNPSSDFLLTQSFDQAHDTVPRPLCLLAELDFVPLGLRFKESEFIPENLLLPNLRHTYRSRKIRHHRLGFNSLDTFLPQSSGLNLPSGDKTTNPETFVFSRILNYDRKYLRIRNAKACRSWRYKIFYHRIEKEILSETMASSNTEIPPTLYIGPLFLKEKGISVNGSCGYGLGYLKRGSNKFYMNPVTGLISIYQNSFNENFNGDDQTTYFGVSNGRGYYTDKNAIKYFYVDNYDDSIFKHTHNELSPPISIQSRKNPFYWKREYYADLNYLKFKKLSGPWRDIRGSVRHSFKDLYDIKRDENSINKKDEE